MKYVKQLTFAVLAAVAMISCDKAEELLEFDLDFSLEETMPVVTTADPQSFAVFEIMNPSDDGNIEDNLDKIKRYTIETMAIEFSDVPQSGTYTADELKITFTGNSSIVSLALPGATPITNASLPFELDDALSGDLREMLLSGEDITIGVSATISGGPVAFNLKLSIDGKITVGP